LERELQPRNSGQLIAGPSRTTGALVGRLKEPPLRLAQGRYSFIDLAALVFEIADLGRDLIKRQTSLKVRVAMFRFLARKNFAYLGQRESEPFAFEYHLEMKPVTGIVAAHVPLALRVQQSTILVKPQSPHA
jgi:hypothetical protein